jgi:NAD(P)-dependent dehydrogenase (short-subunit alcohol dehydrogenase family)
MGLPDAPAFGASALAPGTFADAVVLVTGGGTGLGKAIAVEFARLGAAVAIFSRKDEHLEAGCAAIEAAGGRAFATTCDIREPDQIAVALDAITEAFRLPMCSSTTRRPTSPCQPRT